MPAHNGLIRALLNTRPL